jgi:hypothetical protein
MALDASFIADFSSFMDATRDAVAAMEDFKTTTEGVGPATDQALATTTAHTEALGVSLQQVGEDAAASGERFVAAAEQETAAVSEVNQALEQTRVIGSTVGKGLPEQFDQITEASGRTAGAGQTLRQSYQQVDGVLNALGVHIGPQVKALSDLMSVFTKGVSTLGLFASAGIAAAAAIAAFKLGSWIAEWTGLDKEIGKAATSLQSWALIKLGVDPRDVRDLADAFMATSSAIDQAKASGMSYADVIRARMADITAALDKEKDWAATLAATQREVRGISAARAEEIILADKAGASAEELKNKYGVTAAGLQVLIERMRVSADQTDKHAAAQLKAADAAKKHADELKRAAEAALELADKQAAAMRQYYNWLGERRMEDEAARMAVEQAAQQQRAAAIAEQTQMVEDAYQATVTAAQAATAAQVVSSDTAGAAIAATGEAHAAMGAAAVVATGQASAGYAGMAQQAAQSAEAIYASMAKMQYMAQIRAIEATQPWNMPTSAGAYWQMSKIPVPRMPGAGGAGATITNTFNITDTESNIARRVSEEIMRTVRAGTQLGTA